MQPRLQHRPLVQILRRALHHHYRVSRIAWSDDANLWSKINEFGGGQELLFPSAIMGIIYIVMAGMIVPLTVYILRGAREAKAAAMQGDNDSALRFLEASKKFWEYYGIITIILFIISLLLIPAAMIASLMTV